ncbi:MAG: hypothetical protein EOM10_05435 [Opitutae bacterium]|nr:hypothetical protein [Opitutae bacterium]
MYSRVKRRPVCFVIAGPNGAGKTTYARLSKHGQEALNALREAVSDAIARHRRDRIPVVIRRGSDELRPSSPVVMTCESRPAYSPRPKKSRRGAAPQ